MELVKILQGFCNKKGWEYVECTYDEKHNWVVIHYNIFTPLMFSIRKDLYAYCMEIDNNKIYTRIMYGLNGKLKDCKIIDIDNFPIKLKRI